VERGYTSVNYYEFSSGDKGSREKSRAERKREVPLKERPRT
jgi:hypothetical protein